VIYPLVVTVSFKGLVAVATLFIYFVFTITYIHNYISTIHSSISSRRGLSPFSSLLSLSGKNLPGVPSRELNSGLPYSRPARYQLSYAAPFCNDTKGGHGVGQLVGVAAANEDSR
jgi:hypothetical protein